MTEQIDGKFVKKSVNNRCHGIAMVGSHYITIDMFVRKTANKEKNRCLYSCDKIFTADMQRYENFIRALYRAIYGWISVITTVVGSAYLHKDTYNTNAAIYHLNSQSHAKSSITYLERSRYASLHNTY